MSGGILFSANYYHYILWLMAIDWEYKARVKRGGLAQAGQNLIDGGKVN